MKKKSFTLVDLIVICVITIFGALLVPQLCTAKDTTVATSCISSLKQIIAATSQYQHDNGDFYPCASRSDKEKPDIWMGLVQTKLLTGYVPWQISVWGCPDNKLPKNARGRSFVYNYAYNSWGFAPRMQRGEKFQGFKNSMFKNLKNASNTVVFQDGVNGWNNPNIAHWDERFMNPDLENSSASKAHNGGKIVNVSFADGHCDFLKAPEQTWLDRRKNGAFFGEVFPDATFWYHTSYK